MADKDEILAAIAELGTNLRGEIATGNAALTARIDANHADLMGKIDVIANGTGRIEADVATVKREVRELQARLDRKLDRHDASRRSKPSPRSLSEYAR
jgi:hypothetical protein